MGSTLAPTLPLLCHHTEWRPPHTRHTPEPQGASRCLANISCDVKCFCWKCGISPANANQGHCPYFLKCYHGMESILSFFSFLYLIHVWLRVVSIGSVLALVGTILQNQNVAVCKQHPIKNDTVIHPAVYLNGKSRLADSQASCYTHSDADWFMGTAVCMHDGNHRISLGIFYLHGQTHKDSRIYFVCVCVCVAAITGISYCPLFHCNPFTVLNTPKYPMVPDWSTIYSCWSNIS